MKYFLNSFTFNINLSLYGMNILKPISDFFKSDKVEYWHRDCSIEVIAVKNRLDIDFDILKREILTKLKNEGRVEVITKLRHRLHVTFLLHIDMLIGLIINESGKLIFIKLDRYAYTT